MAPKATGVGGESDTTEAKSASDEGAESGVGPGAALREARQQMGLDAGEVARSLKVDEDVITALEGERYGELPALVYTRGYVRRYAGLVGLDADALCAQLDALQRDDPAVVRMSSTSRSTSVAALYREHAGVLFGSVVSLVVVAIVAAVWIAWRSAKDPVVEPIDSPLATEPPADLGVPSDETNPPVGALAATDGHQTADTQATVAESDDVNGENSPAGPLAVTDELEFLFSDDCWVEVRGGEGELLHMDLARAGDTLNVTGDAPFSIVLGYAPGVRLTYNGDAVALGPHTRNRKAELVLGH
ncbi:MAG: DUF4115 domain-containing protein [Gammaproteobacteria bacterium]|nr:DUF4115 domain-containing protein [Gammaproteobacteria bacterium]